MEINVLILILFLFLLPSAQMSFKNALLEEQDISPDANTNLLQQTEDQNLDSTLTHLEPPIYMEDYMFDLTEEDGISDLFPCSYSFGL